MKTYVDVLDDSAWGLEKVSEAECESACERMQDWLSDNEGDSLCILVRRVREGECAGLYRKASNGGMQILGHTIPSPEAVVELTNLAWEHACETWSEVTA